MNAILRALAEIDQTAERLRELAPKLAMPRESYTLEEAAAKLNQLGVSYWHLGMNLRGSPGEETKVEYQVWDGSDHYKAATLTGAVNACVSAHTAAPEDPITEAQGLLDGAQDPFEDTAEAKRRERESGQALAAAMGVDL